MPSVHYSSFEARLALTRAEEEESGDSAILGFLDQTRNVLVGVNAALERAATEHWSMVLEGVHLVPGMVTTSFKSAFVVQCVVAIEDENLHRSHFWVREYHTEGLRPLEKYLESLPQIRQIQDYLVDRAHRYDVPVIVNDSLERAIGDVMDLVLRRADQLVGTA
jgi:2-phosphoglycerate kinase